MRTTFTTARMTPRGWATRTKAPPKKPSIDRCWAWHARHAPEGRCVFDQHAAAEKPALPLNAGHERWSYHDTSAYVIAYAVSPGGKRGLWEIFAAPDPTQTRPPRLLRESNTAWHCNMDTTGRIAVIDTSAPWDSDPATGAAYDNGVAAHLQADRDRTPTHLRRSSSRSKNGC
ncbi:hypothetical protein Ga0100230_022330 [Opitutaceae bacterium TAV3]|nr:hypothetical protein Ga0100230_022330 [Opitutaceae bacterium TAV3]